MSFPQFGEVIEEKSTPQFKEFGEVIEGFEEEGKEHIPGYRSALKGIGKAITSLPTFQKSPISPKMSERILNELLPTPETGLYPYVESISEGAAEGAKFGPTGAIAGGAGKGLKELAKQKNAPAWVQTLADIAPWLFTEGGLIPKKDQKASVDLLRDFGFSDKEITPLLQGKTKLSMLGKIGKKGPRVEERLEKISDNFKKSYDIFREAGQEKALPRNKIREFTDKFEDVWDEIPVDQKKILRELKEDFLSKPITRASMQDFFHGINRNIYGKGAVGKKEILAQLKEPIYEGMEMTEKGSSQDFKLLNELNTKKYEVLRKLSPNQIDHLASLAEFGGILKYLATGNFKAVGGVLGEVAARQLATELLINPNLQNISNKMAVSLAKNQIPIYEKLSKKFMEILNQKNPELHDKILKEQNEQEKGQPKRAQ